MRLGVLDVGSNTVHLLVVDARHGAAPEPAFSEKSELRLAELSGPDGSIGPAGADRLAAAVGAAARLAAEYGVDELLAFATSALREAPDGLDVVARVGAETGVALEVLSGDDEARLTFLAVRRWLGWSAGRLLVVDIGGGSLEAALGVHEDPDVAGSVPVGVGAMTRRFLHGDPPSAADLRALRAHVRAELAPLADRLRTRPAPDRVAGTSKTFRTLARLAGAPAGRHGPLVRRRLAHPQVAAILSRIAPMTAAERAGLDGVLPARAVQLVAGAVVADVAMEAFGVAALDVCPWALREGVILRRLDLLPGR